MRKVTVNEWMSFDGVVQSAGADDDTSNGFAHGGWHIPYFDQTSQQWVADGYAEAPHGHRCQCGRADAPSPSGPGWKPGAPMTSPLTPDRQHSYGRRFENGPARQAFPPALEEAT